MSKPKKLPKWIDVYPQGTKDGNEEQKFFIAIGRHPKYIWRSVAALAKEANLTAERVEQIIQKYFKKGMIIQNPQSENQWGYWERVPANLLPQEDASVSNSDKKKRIDKAQGSNP